MKTDLLHFLKICSTHIKKQQQKTKTDFQQNQSDFSPIVQLSPVHPMGQVQMYPPIRLRQVPPLEHTLPYSTHSWISGEKKRDSGIRAPYKKDPQLSRF